MAMKINSLELENVKRIKAVKITPAENGITVIGGNNGQGKTSVLDAIAWVLGGDRFRPSDPERDGSVLPPSLKITMKNGLVVERKGKNSSLSVTDPTGGKGGQQLLNEFVEALALNLPKFMESSDKEKASTLLQIIGVQDELARLEKEEAELYQQRLMIGRIADQKQKFADEMTYYPDAPKDLVSASELIARQQNILAKNAENQSKRNHLTEIENEAEELKSKISELNHRLTKALADLKIARKDALFLQDESTEELERDIANAEQINIKVRANFDKEKAEEEAKTYHDQYGKLSGQIEIVRNAKTKLINNASLPLPGLSVDNGCLIYNGQKWDCMSGSDQLKVATAIVRKLNPECGFVLLDKLEQMDLNTLNEFGKWLEAEGLQAIATRVSTGDECSVIIEDGYVAETKEAVAPAAPKWGGKL